MRTQTIRVVLCHDKVVTPMTVCSPCLGARTSRHSIGGRSEQTSGSGQLRDILGGILSSPQAKAVLAGIAAMVVRRVMQGSSRTA